MNVFIGMEESQTIQRAFEDRGHNAWSCDFKPGRLNPSRHIQGDVHDVLRHLRWTPDLLIFHPSCRFLSVSGQHWTGKPGQRTVEDREKAVEDFMVCTRYAGKVCIENPVSIMSRRWRKPDQIIQPYQFGEDASKSTCLWLQELPALQPGRFVSPRMVCQGCWRTFEWACDFPKNCAFCFGRVLPRWANQTNSGQNKLGPTKDPEDRRAARAVTYQGPAIAMAEQWGIL